MIGHLFTVHLENGFMYVKMAFFFKKLNPGIVLAWCISNLTFTTVLIAIPFWPGNAKSLCKHKRYNYVMVHGNN